MIRGIEIPLYDALEAEYPDKVSNEGWAVCGPAGLALPQILEAREGVPVGKVASRIVSIYDPPGKLQERADQTSLLIPLSNGRILFVDPIYELGFKGRREREGAIVIKSYAPSEIKEALRAEYHLVPFFIPPPGRHGKIGLFGMPGEELTWPAYFDMISALNDGSAFRNRFVGRATGKTRDVSAYWGDRVNRVIHSVVNFDKRN